MPSAMELAYASYRGPLGAGHAQKKRRMTKSSAKKLDEREKARLAKEREEYLASLGKKKTSKKAKPKKASKKKAAPKKTASKKAKKSGTRKPKAKKTTKRRAPSCKVAAKKLATCGTKSKKKSPKKKSKSKKTSPKKSAPKKAAPKRKAKRHPAPRGPRGGVIVPAHRGSIRCSKCGGPHDLRSHNSHKHGGHSWAKRTEHSYMGTAPLTRKEGQKIIHKPVRNLKDAQRKLEAERMMGSIRGHKR